MPLQKLGGVNKQRKSELSDKNTVKIDSRPNDINNAEFSAEVIAYARNCHTGALPINTSNPWTVSPPPDISKKCTRDDLHIYDDVESVRNRTDPGTVGLYKHELALQAQAYSGVRPPTGHHSPGTVTYNNGPDRSSNPRHGYNRTDPGNLPLSPSSSPTFHSHSVQCTSTLDHSATGPPAKSIPLMDNDGSCKVLPRLYHMGGDDPYTPRLDQQALDDHGNSWQRRGPTQRHSPKNNFLNFVPCTQLSKAITYPMWSGQRLP